MPGRPSPASLSDRQHPRGPPPRRALAAGCPPAQLGDRIKPPTNPPLPAPREEGQSSLQSHTGSTEGLSASHLGLNVSQADTFAGDEFLFKDKILIK